MAHNTETDTQVRLRRAMEALKNAREAEAVARIALSTAVQSTARAKTRYEELFHQDQREEVARRMRDYRHATK